MHLDNSWTASHISPMTTGEESTIARHPIGVVADRTRLSQDVLRVWERRYGVVEPGRSASGQRLYSDADIERLRLLGLATGAGRSISLIAPLPTAELEQLVREDADARKVERGPEPDAPPPSDILAPALERIVALDGPGLELMLRRTLLTAGLPAFLDSVATPLLRRLGDEWHAGRLAPSQEHLGSAIVQRVISAALLTVTAPPGAPNLVIATPAGERHEIGAVLAAAAAASEGWRVTYLGADLPARDIADAAVRTDATAVGLSIIYVTDRKAVIAEVRALRELLPASIQLLIGGGASAALASELAMRGVRVLAGLGDLRHAMRGEIALPDSAPA